MADDDAAVCAVRMLRQRPGDVFVGQAVEAVALDAFGRETARQRKLLRDVGLTAVKRRIEAGNLGHFRQQGAQGFDAGDVVRLVQGSERDETFQVAENGVVDHDRLRVTFAAMNDAVTDRDDLPAAVTADEPLQQGIEGSAVIDLVAFDDLVGNAFASAVFGDQAGGAGAQAVDLAGDLGFW